MTAVRTKNNTNKHMALSFSDGAWPSRAWFQLWIQSVEKAVHVFRLMIRVMKANREQSSINFDSKLK